MTSSLICRLTGRIFSIVGLTVQIILNNFPNVSQETIQNYQNTYLPIIFWIDIFFSAFWQGVSFEGNNRNNNRSSRETEEEVGLNRANSVTQLRPNNESEIKTLSNKYFHKKC